ncbi:DNA replication and repair protein RecO [Lutibacter oricola]|uniref:DNA repair protein RecO n=1 Tax=Lutibacter oricola TaxID=762486 RepID=A0A1H2QH95_9FLAO|nr:DNA repair protein RecO [Lutibacter oricola]SDW06541.1 DNA replication and repair protein RecO [Lutibacter oricola]
MLQTTKAIVLNSIKYGETSLISTCYTENYGVKTYMIKGVLKSRKGKFKAAYFQPLTQLNLEANHNTKGALNSIRELQVSTFYTSIYTDIKKQSIALFLAEILFYSIKEEEENKSLFKYLETSFMWLDTHNNIANFHLLFLLNLTKFLGFYPEVSSGEKMYFDLTEGRFTSTRNYNCVYGGKLTLFKKVLGTNFDAIHKVDLNAAERQEILLILIKYFELHLSGFKKPKSLEVLKSIFN